MASGLIGALRVTLGLDASDFEAGTTKAQAQMRGFQREFKKSGRDLQKIGKDMSTYLTVPILGAGAAIIKTAGDFQASMIQVGINANATGKQMAAMREQALNIGKDTAKSASEAADAMNILAKTGMSAKDILAGGAKAAVDLAIATGSELDPAAAAVSDTMKQFNVTSKDLPKIINTITGAVNESKFEFADFQLGMGMAGAVASAAGVNFDDFAAALAGTSSMFASGSDAGTSFKTFLLHLQPQTAKAAALMQQYGLSFYDAQGNMKSMADIAQMLQDKLAGLSAEDRNAVMLKVFGTDGVRTAIGLMKLGSKGLEEMNARIQGTSAADQAAARMKGFNGQLEQMKGALETLAIRIADSGMLAAATSLVQTIGSWVDVLGKASPETLKWATIIAGLVAVIGPVLIVIAKMVQAVGILLPLITKLGPVVQVLATAMGYLAPVLMAVGRALLMMLANPFVLGAAVLIGGIYLAWKNWDKIAPIVQRMVAGVTGWLQKLASPFNWVHDKLTELGHKFFELYDKVVGHSYIPDMVDEIGKHMARLQGNMVNPTKKATADTAAAFQQLRTEVGSILDRLYPDQAETNRYMQDLDTLQKGLKALGFTADQAADATHRLWAEHVKNQTGKDPDVADVSPDLTEAKPLDKLPGPDLEEVMKSSNAEMKNDTKQTTQDMVQAWADFATSAVGSVRDMVSAFKSGDIMGGILSFLDLVKNVIQTLQQVGAIKSGSGGGGAAPRAPGYSTGGAFKVGGSGGVDSQLVQFRATPGEHVAVRRGDQMNKGGSTVIVRVVKGEMFDAHVERVARPIGEDAAQRGAAGGANLAARNSFRARRSALA